MALAYPAPDLTLAQRCAAADWVGEAQVLGERWKGQALTEIRLLSLYKGDPAVTLLAISPESFGCSRPVHLHRGQRGILFLVWDRSERAMLPLDDRG